MPPRAPRRVPSRITPDRMEQPSTSTSTHGSRTVDRSCDRAGASRSSRPQTINESNTNTTSRTAQLAVDGDSLGSLSSSSVVWTPMPRATRTTPQRTSHLVPTPPSGDITSTGPHTPRPLLLSGGSSRRPSLLDSMCTLPPLQARTPSMSSHSLPLTPTQHASGSSAQTQPRRPTTECVSHPNSATGTATPIMSATNRPSQAPPVLSGVGGSSPGSPASSPGSDAAQVIVQRLYRSVVETRPEEPWTFIIEQLKETTGKSSGGGVTKMDDKIVPPNNSPATARPPRARRPSANTLPSPPKMQDDTATSGGISTAEVPVLRTNHNNNINANTSSSNNATTNTEASVAQRRASLAPLHPTSPFVSDDSLTPTGGTSSVFSTLRNFSATTNSAHPHAGGGTNMRNTSAANVSAPMLRNAGALHPPPQSRPRQQGLMSSTNSASVEDSSRSDLSSMFSVSSIDLTEFLQEFRVAKTERLGEECKDITLDELGLILENVTFPVPDMGIIGDLFDELSARNQWASTSGGQHSSSAPGSPNSPTVFHPTGSARVGKGWSPAEGVGVNNSTSSQASTSAPAACVVSANARRGDHHNGEGSTATPLQAAADLSTPSNDNNILSALGDTAEPRVSFETFLARMAFKIQGRYPSDVISHAFFELVARVHGSGVTMTGSVFLDDDVSPHQTWTESSPAMPASPVMHDGIPPRSVDETAVPVPSVSSSTEGHQSVDPPLRLLQAGSTRTVSARPPPPIGHQMHMPTTGSFDSLATSDTFLATVTQSSPRPSHGMAGAGSPAFASLVQTVPLRVCIVDGLQNLLGMRGFNGSDAQQALRMASLPDSDLDYACHLADFSRLVHALASLVHGSASVAGVSPNATSIMASLKEPCIHTAAI